MYFLRVRPLKDQLAREGLTEKDRFGYLMAWMIMITLMSVSASDHPPMVVFLLFVITVAGVIWAWRKNGGRDGTGIFDRYLSIGLVVNLRVLLALYVIIGVIAIMPGLQETLGGFTALFGFAGGGDIEEPGGKAWLDPVLLAAEAWVAWSIGRHIGQIRATAPSVAQAVPFVDPARSAERLDRVVEHVMRSETQGGVAIEAGTAVSALVRAAPALAVPKRGAPKLTARRTAARALRPRKRARSF